MSIGPQALFTFPGIDQIISGTITVSEGISPSIAVLEIAPQFDLTELGDTLELWYGGNLMIAWPNCKLDYSSLTVDARGWVTHLTILDRRWKWHEHNGGDQVSGHYNKWRDDFSLEDGKVDPNQANSQTNNIDTERDPQELLTLCFQGLNETGFDISRVPTDTRPEVDWSYTNPAHALADLLDDLGCVICPQADDTFAVFPVGQGNDLPDLPSVSHPTFTLDPPEMPDKIVIVCNEVFQVDLDLESVALDVPAGFDVAIDSLPTSSTDDQPIASGDITVLLNDVSYRRIDNDPNEFAGFNDGDLNYFTSVGKNNVSGKDVTGMREMAIRSFAKYFRVIVPQEIPAYADADGNTEIASLEQILPLQDQVMKWWTNAELRQIPAALFGLYHQYLDGNPNSIASAVPAPVLPPRSSADPAKKNIYYLGDYQVDHDRGLVIASQPIFQNLDASVSNTTPGSVTAGPAEMFLRCSCEVRDATTLAVKKYERSRTTGANSGAGKRYIVHPEITLTHIPIYDPNSYSLKGDITNKASVDKQCDFYLDQAMLEYEATSAQQLTYNEIVVIELDGAIRQVTYNIGPGTTTASRNSETRHSRMTFRERRLMEKTRKAVADAKIDKRRAAGLTKPGQGGVGGGF